MCHEADDGGSPCVAPSTYWLMVRRTKTVPRLALRVHVLRALALSCSTKHQRNPVNVMAKRSVAMVDVILKFLGIPFMQPLTFWFLAGIAFALSVASGWIADEIMGSLTLGIAINAVVLLLGALLTLFGWRYFGMPLQNHYVYLFIVAVGFFPACFLLLVVFLKRFF
jgi:uncharacterized membrane protein YeaQ/YmgE (transglycosylase-associated protein family)